MYSYTYLIKFDDIFVIFFEFQSGLMEKKSHEKSSTREGDSNKSEFDPGLE